MAEVRHSGMPRPLLFVIVAIVVLTLAGMIATIAVSAHFGVADGYIPPEDRTVPSEHEE